MSKRKKQDNGRVSVTHREVEVERTREDAPAAVEEKKPYEAPAIIRRGKLDVVEANYNDCPKCGHFEHYVVKVSHSEVGAMVTADCKRCRHRWNIFSPRLKRDAAG
jgi:DNA-directed RNA polymerase subunit M/transcription elongation factor TFIIS